MNAFKSWMESNLGPVLMIALAAGLVVPGIEQVPRIIVPSALAAIIFFGASKITVEDLRHIHPRDFIGFYVFRFLVLPFLFFGLASVLLPQYQYSVLLIMLMPCGVTLPAMAAILGGNVALGLTATVVTSLFVPFIVPLAFSAVGHMGVELDIWGMFKTLVLVVLAPVAVYFLLGRRWDKAKLFVRRNSSFAAVGLIGIIAVIIVASMRAQIFAHPAAFAGVLALALGVYALLYTLGWVVFMRKARDVQIGYALVSGNNNIALGISVAFLYFPPSEVMMLIACEIAWLVVLSGFQVFLRRCPA